MHILWVGEGVDHTPEIGQDLLQEAHLPSKQSRAVRFSLQLAGNIDMPDLSWTVDAISLQGEMP